eukprot:CAMPEP_0202693774 /NCGR_PEP_ID=MMETSP1385-20130828/7806_1 /ASSEMBLY_ACC=CAM_ASM_000861 /TAXON_ID=933848 /ORGANISM="Elphidium margaritaceum" /LENGTH=366 /DNA_ID=CAMNT_0049349505 /DNA_START=116 /DNA_END=1216 /DNA_ORIENTATION=+
MEIDEETLKTNLKRLNESQLKDKCGKLGVDPSGNKEEVIERILSKVVIRDDAANGKSPTPTSSGSTDDNKENTITYTKEQLQTLSKAELSALIKSMYSKNGMIAIIMRRQKKIEVDESLKERNARKNNAFADPHEKVVQSVAFGEKLATDYAKIEKQREIIKQLKEKRKVQNEESLKDRNARKNNNVFADPHEKVMQSVNFGEKHATDYAKIEKQREIIKQLKEKRKGHNDLKSRNAQKTDALFSDAHEKVVKVKPLKQPAPKKRRRKKKNGDRKKIMDPVSKEILDNRKKLQMQDGTFEYEEDDNEDDLDYEDDEDYDYDDDDDDEDYDFDEAYDEQDDEDYATRTTKEDEQQPKPVSLVRMASL